MSSWTYKRAAEIEVRPQTTLTVYYNNYYEGEVQVPGESVTERLDVVL